MCPVRSTTKVPPGTLIKKPWVRIPERHRTMCRESPWQLAAAHKQRCPALSALRHIAHAERSN